MTKKKKKDSAPVEKIDAGISQKTLKPSPKGFAIPWDSFWFNLLVLAIIIVLAFSLRTLYLRADPPSDLDWSQGPFTDPPQYTTFARYEVLWGEWDLFGHNRFVMFLKSATTLISFFIFKILGVGRWQLNFIPVLLSILSILIVYFVLRKEKKRIALFSALFLGINYLFLMQNRCLYVENTAIFIIAIGFLILALSSQKSTSGGKGKFLPLFLSGFVFTIPPFFAKLQSAFIPVVALLVLIISLLGNSTLNNWRKRIVPIVYFIAGAVVTLAFWLFFVYLPASSQVSGYLFEQSTGLYGKPHSLESIGNFLKAIFSFGQVSGVYVDELFGQGTNLFYRMPLIFLLSIFYLLIFAFRLFAEKTTSDAKENKFLKNLSSFSENKLFFVLWTLASFVALFPWNYRPLRYQLLFIFPLCVLAAFGTDELLNKKDLGKRGKVSFLFYLFSFILITFGMFHLISFYLKLKGSLGSYSSVLGISIFLSIVVNVVLYFILAGREKRKKPLTKGTQLRWAVALLVILLFLFIQISQFLTWAKNPQYSLYKSSVDLGSVLNPDAVVSGPYCSALTIDNRLRNVIHMFGVAQVDTFLFQKFPITHLAMERGINKQRAFEDYPNVMKDAKVVTTYWIRSMPVDIYRIAETSGNPKTQNYKLSNFEEAKLLLEQGQVDSAIVRLNQFVSQSPHNFSGYRALAEIYYDRKDFEKAASYLEKASKFDPTDFVAHQFLGAVYLNLYNQKRDDTYRLLAIEEWEKALKLFPQNDKLAAQLQNIKGY